MIAARKIAAVLGGRRTLGREVRSERDLIDAVTRGLPKAALERCVEHVSPEHRKPLLHRVVARATLARRGARLTMVESERTERLARIVATAETVLGDAEEARLWLERPHLELGGQTPLDVAVSEPGARLVERILWKGYFGLPA